MKWVNNLFKRHLFVLKRAEAAGSDLPAFTARTAFGSEKGKKSLFKHLEQAFTDDRGNAVAPHNITLSAYGLDIRSRDCRMALASARRHGTINRRHLPALEAYKDETLSRMCSVYAMSYRHALNLKDRQTGSSCGLMLTMCVSLPEKIKQQPENEFITKNHYKILARNSLACTRNRWRAGPETGSDTPASFGESRAVLLGWEPTDLGRQAVSFHGIAHTLKHFQDHPPRECRLLSGSVDTILRHLKTHAGKTDTKGYPLQPLLFVIAKRPEGYPAVEAQAVTDPCRVLMDNLFYLDEKSSVLATLKARAAHMIHTLGGAEQMGLQSVRAALIPYPRKDETFFTQPPTAQVLAQYEKWQSMVKADYEHRFTGQHLFTDGPSSGYWLCRMPVTPPQTAAEIAGAAAKAMAAFRNSASFEAFYKQHRIQFCEDLQMLRRSVDKIITSVNGSGVMVLADDPDHRVDANRSKEMTREMLFAWHCRKENLPPAEQHRQWRALTPGVKLDLRGLAL